MDFISIDDRVVVDGKLGVVRYAGLTDFSDGFWYGVELDGCEGFNDGSVDGKRYFDVSGRCGNYGIFAQSGDLIKIDDSVALRDENRKLTSLVEALERKVRQLHLQRNQWDQDSVLAEVQRAVETLTEQRDDMLLENEQLHTALQTLEAKESLREAGAVKSLQKKNDTLSEALRTVNEEVDKLKEDNRQFEALYSVYVEIEAELKDQIKELEDYIRTTHATASSPPITSSEAAKIALFSDLCSTIFPKGQLSPHNLRMQYEFLLKCLSSGAFSLSLPNELIGRIYFSVLHALTSQLSQGESNGCLITLQEKFSNSRASFNMLLTGHFDQGSLDFSQLVDFLDGLETLDSNVRLMIPLLVSIFSDLMPKLLAYHRKKGLSGDVSTSVGNLYSCSLSIRDEAKKLDEKVRSDPNSLILSDMRLSHVLEVLIALINCQPSSDDRYFKSFEVKLNEILDAVCLAKVTSVQGNDDDHTDLEEEQDIKVLMLESELSEKDAKIKELEVKTQLLELKLEAFSQAARLKTDDSAIEVPEDGTLDDSDLLLVKQHFEDSSTSDSNESNAPPKESSKSFQSESLARKNMNNEINDLRRVVASLTKHKYSEVRNFDWLYDNKRNGKTSEVEHIQVKNKVHDLAMSALEIVRHTEIVNYQGDQPERQKHRMANTAFKQRVLDSKLRDLSA